MESEGYWDGPGEPVAFRARRVAPYDQIPMGKPPKHRVENSRVTAKGTKPQGEKTLTSRPPVTHSTQKVSPMWVPVVMFGLLAVGSIVIIVNYLGLLPGGTDNWYLLAGLGLILGGIITATQLH
jgi:hypothetical protein